MTPRTVTNNSVGPHVFGDNRLGCWIVNLAALPDRVARLRALGFTDLFLRGPDGSQALKAVVTGAGFTGCHGWWAVDGLSAVDYTSRALADIARWNPGAGELNIELSNDAALDPYIRTVVAGFRAKRPAYRLRINVAARKGGFLPVDLLQSDPQLFACEQTFADSPSANMASRLSEADALDRMMAWGVPREKASVCYAGAVAVGGMTGLERVAGFPNGWLPTRGVVFHDDLLAEVGLI